MREKELYSRTKHLLVTATGKRWREVWLVGFTVYIDDSGTAPDQRVASATALVIPAPRIIALETEWANLRQKYGFSDFHMSECVARNPKSDFARLDDAQHKNLLNRVRQIGKKFAPVAFSFAVNKPDYDTVVPPELKYHIGNHYSWAMRAMIAALDRWASISGVTLPFEYIFDWMDPKTQRVARNEIETVMAQAEDQWGKGKGRYTNYSFRRRQDLPALQCVDALAWTCYQRALFAHFDVPIKQIAVDSWNDYYRHMNGNWLGAMYMTKDQLKNWMEREAQDGRSLERFRAWEAKHPKAKARKGAR